MRKEVPGDADRTSCVRPKCFVHLARIDCPKTTVEVIIYDRCGGIRLDSGEFKSINRQRAEFQDRLKFADNIRSRRISRTLSCSLLTAWL